MRDNELKMMSHGGLAISFITIDRFAEERKPREKKKTLLSDARKLSDEELLAKLKSLGITAGKRKDGFLMCRI